MRQSGCVTRGCLLMQKCAQSVLLVRLKCRRCALFLDKKSTEDGSIGMNGVTMVEEIFLESFLNAADDIASKGRSGRSVVCFSWGWKEDQVPPEYWEMMRKWFLSFNGLERRPYGLCSGNGY